MRINILIPNTQTVFVPVFISHNQSAFAGFYKYVVVVDAKYAQNRAFIMA